VCNSHHERHEREIVVDMFELAETDQPVVVAVVLCNVMSCGVVWHCVM